MGGFSTKIHITVDDLGNPLRFALTAGQRHAMTCAEGYSSEYVIADSAYDADSLGQLVTRMGAELVIRPRINRRESRDYDTHLYREGHRRDIGWNASSTKSSTIGVSSVVLISWRVAIWGF